jgi:hypothetical protein
MLIVVAPSWLNFAMGPRWVLLSAALPLVVAAAQPSGAACRGPLWTLVWALVGLAWAPHGFAAAFGAWQLVLLCAAWAVGSALVGLRPVAWGLCIGVGVNSGVAMLELAGVALVPSMAPPSGLLANRGVLGGIAAVGLVLAVALLRSWPAALMCAPALVLSSSRAAWMGLAVAGSVWVLRRAGAWRRVVLAWALLLGGYALLKGPSLWQSEALTHRLGVWWDLLGALTWHGAGIGQFESQFPLINTTVNTALGRMEFAHNDWLQLCYELGIGTVPLLWAFGRAASRSHPAALALIALCVIACFDFPLHLPHGILVAGLLAGWLCGSGAGRGADAGASRRGAPQ